VTHVSEGHGVIVTKCGLRYFNQPSTLFCLSHSISYFAFVLLSFQPISVATTIECLLADTKGGRPLYVIQRFVSSMLKMCTKPASNLHVLSWPIWRGTGIIVTTYTRVQGASRLNVSTLERSHKMWLTMKVRELSKSIKFLSKT